MADAPPGIDFSADNPGLEITAGALAALVPQVPQTLYHYTTPLGLLGILDTHKVWASDTRFLNDKTEVAHGADLCRDELSRVQYKGDFGRARGLLVESLTPERFIHFSASFCEEPDLVPQWRGYAAGGAGFSVGIDSLSVATTNDDFMLLPVRYREEDKRAAIRELVAAHAEAWAHYESRPVSEKRQAIGAIGTSVLSGLTALSVSFKPEVFEYEREWRLVNSVSPQFPEQMKGVTFRPSGSAVVPYLEFPLRSGANETASPIREIWVGPTQKNEASKSAIETMCTLKQLAVTVHVSAAPLRF